MNKLLVGLAVTLIPAVISGGVSYLVALKTADTQLAVVRATKDAEMVSLALTILQEPKTPRGLKDWALDVLAKKSDVPLTKEQRERISAELDESQIPFEQYAQTSPQADVLNEIIIDLKAQGFQIIEIPTVKETIKKKQSPGAEVPLLKPSSEKPLVEPQ